jgi:plasmid stabilization system protein ParE
MSARSFRVAWTREAVRDLVDIAAYVAVDSPENARRLLKKLRKRANSLASTPRRGRIVPELSGFGIRTFRDLVAKPYRVVYRIAEDTVYVLAVLDARRDLQDVLLERLLRKRPAG